MWSFLNFLENNVDQEKDQDPDDDYHDSVEKMSALYGEEWRGIPHENLMDNKYFREIPEFIHAGKKTLTCESVSNTHTILCVCLCVCECVCMCVYVCTFAQYMEMLLTCYFSLFRWFT